jgi:hypothetical protein
MAAEKALAVPLTSEEIVDIAVAEYRRRLNMQSPLQGCKEYAGFYITFESNIRLYRMSTNGGGEKETLAWGGVTGGDVSDPSKAEDIRDVGEHKSNPDVNKERLDHDLPLTVETNDGRGGKIRKKVRVKKEAASAR